MPEANPKANKDHIAVFETAEKIGDGKATRLTVRLNQRFWMAKRLLGRFRLSFTNDAATLQATRCGFDLKDSEVTDLSFELAKAHAEQGHIHEAAAASTEALNLAKDRAARARIITEAAALPGVLEELSERTVKDNAERLAFAQLAYDRQDFAFATRLWAEALQGDRKLGDKPEVLTKATAANPKFPAADSLVLALAHAKLKETDQARKARGKAAALLKPTGAETALRPLLREVLIAVGPDTPEATALIAAAAAGEPPAAK